MRPQTYENTQRPLLRSFIYSSFALLVLLLLMSGCANPVSPEGGVKDTTPPRVVGCSPSNFSTRINNLSFRIDFNEFLDLKNPMTEIYISPPLRHPIETRLRGKSLLLRLNDSLEANTTYSITFGNSLTDLTENNVLKGFRYVFCTGDHIDSLSLRGKVTGAFDRQPQKDIFVELYLNNNDTLPFDSLPLKVPPFYITKSDEQGNFYFGNLRPGTFRLFALADQNGDLIFNQPSEKIAFNDSLVSPYFIPPPKPAARKDSVAADSAAELKPLVLNSDSARKADSARQADSVRVSLERYPSFELNLFEQIDSVQRLVKASVPVANMTLLSFRFPVRELTITPLNFSPDTLWHLEEWTRKSDSLRLWITRPGTDSLIARVVADTLPLDTVRLSLAGEEIQKKKKKGDGPDRLAISLPVGTAGFNQFVNPLVLNFSCPVDRWDFSRVFLIDDKDTLHPPISFTDSLRRKVLIRHEWKEFHTCHIIIPDSVFFGINGLTHDTVRLDFRTRGEKDFGGIVISMELDQRPGPRILQLMNEKESIIYEQRVIEGSQKVRFPYLLPGRYKIKEIYDRNRNGHWDTGNYQKKIQPEEVRYFPKILEVRPNWEVEETWN